MRQLLLKLYLGHKIEVKTLVQFHRKLFNPSRLAHKKEGIFHYTGESSLSKYHARCGGNTIWQRSTGYFGCRNQDGIFDEVQFAEKTKLKQVKMV